MSFLCGNETAQNLGTEAHRPWSCLSLSPCAVCRDGEEQGQFTVERPSSRVSPCSEGPVTFTDARGSFSIWPGSQHCRVTERLPQLVKKHRLLSPTSFSIWANRMWSSQVTSVTRTFVGKTVQLCTSHPSGSWNALRTLSCYRCWTC